MSGGYFGYKDENLMEDLFGVSRVTIRSKQYKDEIRRVRRENRLEDLEITELVFDVFGLLHSFDWYQVCDTSREDYLADVKAFKKKWFGRNPEERANKILQSYKERLEEYYKELKEEMEESVMGRE